MTFVHPLLLGGLLLVGIPVLIHLIMRQKPKHLLFPAVRFLLQRQQSNRRRLQLRHLILLALRMLLIAAICLALARPRVLNERLNIAADQPVAAVMSFDLSVSRSPVSSRPPMTCSLAKSSIRKMRRRQFPSSCTFFPTGPRLVGMLGWSRV